MRRTAVRQILLVLVALAVPAPAFAASSVSASVHAIVARVVRSAVDGDVGACGEETSAFQRWFVQTAQLAGVHASTCQQAVADLPHAYAKAHATGTMSSYANQVAGAFNRASVSLSSGGHTATLNGHMSTGAVSCTVEQSRGHWLVASANE